MANDPDRELPDLTRGVPAASITDRGLLVGRVGAEKVIVWRSGHDLHAFSAACPHLGGPLDAGLIEGGTIRCPWHQACFDLTTGEALAAPAFDPLPRHAAALRDGLVIVEAPVELQPVAAQALHRPGGQGAMVIVGGGAAGFAAANALRKRGWAGEVVMFSADADPPYDRTLLTKDYLDGHFGDDRLPIARRRPEAIGTRLALGATVDSIDTDAKAVRLGDGRTQPYAKLLLAMGAEPRRPSLPGADRPHVHCLRSLADCRRILAAARPASRVVVLGGSFIGLEAAASLRSRGLAVDLVAPDEHPMEKVFGRALSDLVVDAHRREGVNLHLGRNIASIDARAVTLDDGTVLPADLVLVGIGVEPRTALAGAAGLALDRGVVVDSRLRTSAPGVFAAGDIARWPDPHTGRAIRVEHWVVAERQGQTAAANMLGSDIAFDMVPFFWTKHFDLSIRYVGHAEDWDELLIEGDPVRRDALVRYRKGGRDLAVATVGRDRDALQAERDMAARLAGERGQAMREQA